MDTSSPWSRAGAPSVTLPPLRLPRPSRPSTSGDRAARRCPVTKRLSAKAQSASAQGLVVGRTGAAVSYRGLSCHRVNSHVRGDAQRDAVGRATFLRTTSVAVRADNPAIQRGRCGCSQRSLVPSIRCFSTRTRRARRPSSAGKLECSQLSCVLVNSALAVQNALVPAVPADDCHCSTEIHQRDAGCNDGGDGEHAYA